MKSGIKLTAILLCLSLLGGCATSRSVLDIPPPKPLASAPDNGKEVYIHSVVDKRLFEANPSSPNIPSLDPSEEQSSAIKARSVARKRNGFGKALGDILLKEGQRVDMLTMATIRQAFREKGYRIIDSEDKTSGDTYIVDADIVKFWSWMNPGFASITLSTEIATDIRIKSPQGTAVLSASAKTSDGYQTGMEGNWIEVIGKGLRAYIDDLKAKLR